MAAELDTGGRAVLLCCAAEDRFALAPAVERLLRVDVESTFVSGIVKDPALFKQAVQKYRAGAFYVLCRSRHLDRMRATKFQMMLIKQGIPEELIASVQVLNERPESVSNPVIEHIKKFGRSSAAAPSPTAWPEDADVEDGEDEALTTPFRLADVVDSPDPISGVQVGGLEAEAAPSQPVSAQPSPTEQVLASDDSPLASPAEPAPYAFEEDHDELLRPRRTGLIVAVAGAVAVAAAAGLGFVVLRGSDDDAAQPAVADVSKASPAAPSPSPDPASPEPQNASPKEPAGDGDGPGEAAPAEAEAEPESGLEMEPEPAPSATASATDQPAVLAALQKGHIRALDSILYAAKVSSYSNFDQAIEYCQGLDVDGVVGWRLATSAELKALVTPHLIKRARYWTEKGASKRSAMLFEGKSKRTKRRKRSYKGGRALCVRDWGAAKKK